jgi:hypothetical protein
MRISGQLILHDLRHLLTLVNQIDLQSTLFKIYRIRLYIIIWHRVVKCKQLDLPRFLERNWDLDTANVLTMH